MGIKVKELRPGSWYIVVNWKGRRVTRQVADNKLEAEQIAKDLRLLVADHGVEIIDRILSKKAKPTETTVAEYAKRWAREIEATDLKLSTVNSYQSNVRMHITPDLGPFFLSEINYPVLKEWIQTKLPTHSKDSIRIMVATLRLIMAEAVREGLLEVNPVHGLGKLYGGAKVGREVADPFTEKELERVLDEAMRQDVELYKFILLLARTGMRIGEAIALQWRDVDFEAKQIFVRRNIPIHGQETTPKSKSSVRKVDMSERLSWNLQRLEKERKADWLRKGDNEIPDWMFCTGEGARLDYSNFRKRFRKVQKQASVRERRPHDLRHTYASLLLSKGADLAYVAKQLGHANPGITLSVYTHWIPGTGKGVVDLLDGEAQTKRKLEGNGG